MWITKLYYAKLKCAKMKKMSYIKIANRFTVWAILLSKTIKYELILMVPWQYIVSFDFSICWRNVTFWRCFLKREYHLLRLILQLCFPTFLPLRNPKRLFETPRNPCVRQRVEARKFVTGDPCWRPDHGYARWIFKQNTVGWINFQVTRIREKYVLAHGPKINVPCWEVRIYWSYCWGELVR